MGSGPYGETPVTKDFDYVIVGSGVAATLIVDRLLDANPLASILVLEAGPRIPSRQRRSWWNLVLDGKTPYSFTYDEEEGPNQESFTCGATPWGFKESRVRAYGGSTMHWGGWSLRYKEEDFECRSRTGKGCDWPFGYAELEPWYTLAEQALSVGGDDSDHGSSWRSGNYPVAPYPWSRHEADLADAMEAVDLAPGHMPIARFNRCMTTGTCKYCPIGARYSAQDHFDRLLADPVHRNLTLITEAPVRRILAERNRAHGVEFRDPASQDWRQVAGNKVIVCAGTYESTKLLLASTSPDWPDGLGNRYDQVGRHIVTHFMYLTRAKRDKNPYRLLQEYDFPTLMTRSWDTPEHQREGKFFIFNDRSRPNIDLAKMMRAGMDFAAIDKAARGPSEAGLHCFIEEFGEADNRLSLDRKTGRFGLPGTRVTFSRHSSKEFDNTIAKAKDKMWSCMRAAGFEPFDIKQYSPRGDHSSGTCRMGSSPDASVTDGDLSIHEIPNLFVCSNAVLPNAAAVNPTLTLSALSLRLGTKLARGVI